MKLKGCITAAVILAAGGLACKDDPTSPADGGTLLVRLVVEAPAASSGAPAAAAQLQLARPDADGPLARSASAAMVEAVSVTLSGPESRTVSLNRTASGFEGTITGLTPGTYSLAVIGSETGLVEFIGAATGINVVAGQTAEATVPIFSLVTALDPITNTDDVGLTFEVTFTDVPIATEYLIEVSTDGTFPSDDILLFPTTQTTATVSVPWPGTYFVRVRAGNDAISADEALPSNSRVVRLFTGFLSFGQLDAATNFLTVPDQVDVYGFDVLAGDGIVAMAFSPEGLNPTSPLTRLGDQGVAAARYSGMASATSKEGRKAAARLASRALLDLDMRLRPMFDADGQNATVFGGDNDIGGQTLLSLNGDEMIVALPNRDGRKSVELRPASGTGEYTVVVSKCDVFSISVGQIFNGDLSDTDCINVNPESVLSLSSDNFDTVLSLWGPDGTLLAANDDFGGGFNSAIPLVSLPVDGTYVILAASYEAYDSGSGTGSYSLALNDASPGLASQLVFRTLPPANVTVRTPFAVEIEIWDANDNFLPTASADVTLQLYDNFGSLIFRASGAGVSGVTELVDPLTPHVSPSVATGQPDFISAMTYDSSSGSVLAADKFQVLSAIDPETGSQAFIGDIEDDFGFFLDIKGLAFDGSRLLGVDASSNFIYEIDPATGGATVLGIVTAAVAIDGFNGLAVDPTDGTAYAVARLAPMTAARKLVTVDLTTFIATDVGVGTLAQDGVAGIAFLPDGTLYAVTGDGATNPEQLWKVDKFDPSSMSFITNFSATGGGEAIATVPGQLTGTTKLTAVNGVATFTGLEINAIGLDYTIAASAPGLIGVVSDVVDVNP
ncbi:MAG: NHL repeat-containing protein [Planctomycetota bacterium]|jgi:hypothetical protein